METLCLCRGMWMDNGQHHSDEMTFEGFVVYVMSEDKEEKIDVC